LKSSLGQSAGKEYKSAGKEYCKDFTVALKILDVFNKKQMCVSLITGKGNDSEDWNCITSIFLTCFNIFFVFGYAFFICVCFMTAI